MPQLPVIAAGSLLDFALAEHAFSMPVGRIGYLYSDKPSVVTSEISDPVGPPLQYTLLSMPFYALGQIHRLIKTRK